MQGDTDLAVNRAALAALLRGAAWPEGDAAAAWFALAEAEGVAVPFARCALQQADARWQAPARSALQAETARELWFAASEQRALAALAQSGLRVLVLKGAALARWLYADPCERPRGDLDVLLSDQAAVPDCSRALATAGYAPSGYAVLPPSFETSLERHGPSMAHVVDVHWRLANHIVFADCFGFEELYADSVPLPGFPQLRRLSAVHALLHACLHRVSNLRLADGDRLVWLADVDLLARAFTAADWLRFEQLAIERGVAGPCASALVASADAFATPLDAARNTRLLAAASGERFDMARAASAWYYFQWTLRLQPWPQRPRFLWRKAFPGFDYMRDHYGLQRRSQLPLAYLRRALVVLRRFVLG